MSDGTQIAPTTAKTTTRTTTTTATGIVRGMRLNGNGIGIAGVDSLTVGIIGQWREHKPFFAQHQNEKSSPWRVERRRWKEKKE